MQFIPPNNSAGPDANPGQILTDTAGYGHVEWAQWLDNQSDLLPEVPHLRTPVDHSARAPIVGINFGIHHSTGNFAAIVAAQNATPPLQTSRPLQRTGGSAFRKRPFVNGIPRVISGQGNAVWWATPSDHNASAAGWHGRAQVSHCTLRAPCGMSA
jgi:hypothetical protein